ncbi:H(+)/Cl(-) exchange transporter ClcA [Methylomonas sp. HW2-6]|uniref:H(+)/Cl(-) exchange transporter ClcA n=1 Tax=Methylomonas sp. HW2-6 TaxID=3376687 RepID=UPI0040436830
MADAHRHRMLPQALAVGVGAGFIAVCFRLSLDGGEAYRQQFLDHVAGRHELGVVVLFGIALAAIAVAAGTVSLLAPETAGSGVPQLKADLAANRRLRWVRILFVKFFSTWLGNSAGLILGRGGPSVQMGAAIGQGLSQLGSGRSPRDSAILLAAGGGAGLAAAFNAPLSGLTFVLEELDRRCSTLEFFVAAVACLSADMVCRALLGQDATFQIPFTPAPALTQLSAFLPLGVCAGLFGALFNYLMLRGRSLADLRGWRRWLWWALLAGLVTFTAFRSPLLLGGGQALIDQLLNRDGFALQIVLAYWSIRFGLTVASANSGAAGGIFMPVLALGALLGWTCSLLIGPLLDNPVDPRLFATVGMAAFFTGVVQAPLTAIVLIIELTGNYALILPLFVACFMALLIAGWLKTSPIYDALMKSAGGRRW